MKATPLNLSESNNISNILRIPKSEQKHYPFFNPDNYANNKQKQNILNMPLKNVFEKKGGLNHNFPNKRNFRDIFISVELMNLKKCSGGNIFQQVKLVK